MEMASVRAYASRVMKAKTDGALDRAAELERRCGDRAAALFMRLRALSKTSLVRIQAEAGRLKAFRLELSRSLGATSGGAELCHRDGESDRALAKRIVEERLRAAEERLASRQRETAAAIAGAVRTLEKQISEIQSLAGAQARSTSQSLLRMRGELDDAILARRQAQGEIAENMETVFTQFLSVADGVGARSLGVSVGPEGNTSVAPSGAPSTGSSASPSVGQPTGGSAGSSAAVQPRGDAPGRRPGRGKAAGPQVGPQAGLQSQPPNQPSSQPQSQPRNSPKQVITPFDQYGLDEAFFARIMESKVE